MFARAVIIASLLAAGVLALYLPSVVPPERLLQQVRAEHALTSAFWGPGPALDILSRALDLYEDAKQAQPLGQAVPAPPPAGAVDAAVAERMTHVVSAFSNNAYFRSLDALFVLALYRVAALLAWLPALSVFVLAAAADGALRRVVKSQSFEEHDAEVAGGHAAVLVVVLCVTLVALVVPLTLHPALLAAVPIAAGVCARFAIANYHRRA